MSSHYPQLTDWEIEAHSWWKAKLAQFPPIPIWFIVLHFKYFYIWEVTGKGIVQVLKPIWIIKFDSKNSIPEIYFTTSFLNLFNVFWTNLTHLVREAFRSLKLTAKSHRGLCPVSHEGENEAIPTSELIQGPWKSRTAERRHQALKTWRKLMSEAIQFHNEGFSSSKLFTSHN